MFLLVLVLVLVLVFVLVLVLVLVLASGVPDASTGRFTDLSTSTLHTRLKSPYQ